MDGRPGFEVQPDALGVVAAGLRRDADAVLDVSVVTDRAVTPVHGAGGPLAAAISELATALDRAAGAARRDLDGLARALDTTALGYRADDRGGASGFGGLLARHLPL